MPSNNLSKFEEKLINIQQNKVENIETKYTILPFKDIQTPSKKSPRV